MFIAGGGAGGSGDGGDSGDGSGDGKGGKGQSGGKDAKGGGKNAKGCGAGSGAGCPNPKHGNTGTTAGDPVDVATGRVYTIAENDLMLPGPLPLILERAYDSQRRDREVGLGRGWSHSLAWRLHVGRRRLQITTGSGIEWDVPLPAVGGQARVGDLLARRELAAFSVTQGSTGLTYRFEAAGLPSGEPPAPPTGLYVLTGVSDAYGNTIALFFQGPHWVGLADSAGRAIRVRRNGARIAAFEVQNGADGGWVAFRTYEHDEHGNLVAARDAYGNAVRYTYDESHLLTSQRTAEGMTTFFRYDKQSRCIETWCERGDGNKSLDVTAPTRLADGKTRAKGVLHTRIEYAANYVEVVTSRGVRRLFMNDGLLEKSVFAGGVHENRFDALGNLVQYVDPLGTEWSWTYDRMGRRTSEKGPLGHQREWAYDENGNIAREVFPDNAIDYVRDRRGAVLRATDALGLVVAYERDPRGLVTRAETADGSVTIMEYDAMGNRVRVREPDGGERRITYDAFGLPIGVVDEGGYTLRFVYGAARELVAVHGPDGAITEYTYDRDLNPVRILGPQGKSEVDWSGYREACEVRKSDGTRTLFRYDREGDLVRIINERGDEHVITRDAEGRVVAERTFDGRTHRYEVDGLGRMTRIESDGGEITEIKYDALDRIVEKTWSDDTKEVFTYGWDGRVLSADNGVVKCDFEYDARSRKVRETQTFLGAAESIESFLGPRDRVKMTSSRGYEERVEFGPMRLPQQILLQGARAPVGLKWDLMQNEIERVLPGGGVIRRAFDANGRMTKRELLSSQSHAVGPDEPQWVGRRPGLVLEQSYSYFANSNLPLRVDNSLRGAVELAHDPIGQILARKTSDAGSEAFSYQPGGNLLEAGVLRDYAPGGRVVRRGSSTYHYDDANRLVAKHVAELDGRASIWRYEWNGKGLLAAVVRPDGTRVENVYDAFARRIQKRVVDRDGRELLVVRYVWDGKCLLHEIRRRPADEKHLEEERTFACLPGTINPFAHRDATVNGQRATADWVYYVPESAGRAELLVDDRGTLLAVNDPKAFGRLVPVPGHPPRASTNARFVGHWEDEETGLFYNQWRFYDPNLGVYLSPEPIGLAGGFRPFGYALNRPLDTVDLDGKAGMWVYDASGNRGRGSANTEGIPTSDVLNSNPPFNPIVAGCLANPSQCTIFGRTPEPGGVRRAARPVGPPQQPEPAHHGSQRSSPARGAEQLLLAGGSGEQRTGALAVPQLQPDVRQPDGEVRSPGSRCEHRQRQDALEHERQRQLRASERQPGFDQVRIRRWPAVPPGTRTPRPRPHTTPTGSGRGLGRTIRLCRSAARRLMRPRAHGFEEDREDRGSHEGGFGSLRQDDAGEHAGGRRGREGRAGRRDPGGRVVRGRRAPLAIPAAG